MGRLIPHRLNLADPTGDEDKVEGAIAHHLVSDVDVGAMRVPSRWAHGMLFRRAYPTFKSLRNKRGRF